MVSCYLGDFDSHINLVVIVEFIQKELLFDIKGLVDCCSLIYSLLALFLSVLLSL